MSLSSSSVLLHTLLILTTFSILSNAHKTSFRPKAIVLKATKDSKTGQYVTLIPQGTPKFPAKLTLDLGGEFTWIDCQTSFNSSTRRPVLCRSAACNLSGSRSCTYNPNISSSNDICIDSPINTAVGLGSVGEFSSDTAEFKAENGMSASISSLLFSCAPGSILLPGLADGAVGMAGLGRARVSLPSLLSAAFSFPRRFSVCLSSSAAGGSIIFGGDEISKLAKTLTLTYTPLIRNPVSLTGGYEGEPSSEYFIRVESIRVNKKTVPVNASLLAFDESGHGGAKISTVTPHTILESSIFEAVVAEFSTGIRATRSAPVSPFSACYLANEVKAVPEIELVLQNERSVWRIEGSEAIVRVNEKVVCLAIVDGGPIRFVDWGIRFTPTAVVLAGAQIEDKLLHFDLASSRLGFSSTKTTCSNFKM